MSFPLGADQPNPHTADGSETLDPAVAATLPPPPPPPLSSEGGVPGTAATTPPPPPPPLPQEPVESARRGPSVRDLPRVIAVANQKGGVGKTTTAVNLGACLADLGYRTLVIDLDPQGNASTGLGINPRALESSMYDVLLNDVPLEDCIEGSAVRNLFVAPASLDLAGAEIELVPAFSRELRLKKAIGEVSDDYDYVLIDCPPSLGLLTVNAMAAAAEVLVPIQCEYYALEGLGQLLRNVDLVQKNLNPGLEVSAIVLVMYDARTKLADQVAAEVREHFGDKVCRNVVPRTRPTLRGPVLRSADHHVRPELPRGDRLPRAGQGGERWHGAAGWVRAWEPSSPARGGATPVRPICQDIPVGADRAEPPPAAGVLRRGGARRR